MSDGPKDGAKWSKYSVEDGKLVKKRKIPRYFVVPFPQHLQKDKKAK